MSGVTTAFARVGALALCLGTGAACAQDYTLGVGVAHIMVDSKSPNLSSNGPAFLTPQPAGLDIDDATTLLITLRRRIDAQWDAELAVGVPPKHKVMGTGNLSKYGVVSQVKQAAPTVFLNYKFGAEGHALRPFVGVGVNYTRFYDGESSASGSLASGGPTRIKLTSSTGMAAQAGVNYKFNSLWSLCVSLAYADVQSDLTATTGSIDRTTHIKFNPTVLGVALGYSF